VVSELTSMKNGELIGPNVASDVSTTVICVLVGHVPTGPSTALAMIAPLKVCCGVT
jgi:hypothetical protein